MDVNQAVQIAKQYVSEIFESESIASVGLEEVVYEDESDTWKITVGFSRLWHRRNPQTAAEKLASPFERSYKVVQVDDQSGKVESLKDRILVTRD